MKAVLFIFGRLHFLESSFRHYPLTDVLDGIDIDVFVHGDKTYKEVVVDTSTVYSGVNDPIAVRELIRSSLDRSITIEQENNKFFKRTKMLMYRWKWLTNILTEQGYPDTTTIMTIRGDVAHDFTDIPSVQSLLINGTDKWHCSWKNESAADDLMFVTNLGLLKKYIDYCKVRVTELEFDSHNNLAEFLNINECWEKLPCDTSVIRNTTTDFSSIKAIAEASDNYNESRRVCHYSTPGVKPRPPQT